MAGESSIFSRKDYGYIRLKLKERMNEQQINRYTLAKRIDSRFEVIDKWFSGEVERIDLDILARICFVLNCPVSDILEYVPENKSEDVP